MPVLAVATPGIRAATAADVPALVAMGCRFLAETSYGARLRCDPVHMTHFALALLQHHDGHIFVAEQDGHPVGMLAVQCFLHPYSGDRYAAELWWWVNPEARGHGLRLLRAAEVWAKAHGAVKLHMIAPTDTIGHLYARRGYVPLETTYERSL